jgi:glycosyltransferase involved in cell wall biosynthesis
MNVLHFSTSDLMGGSARSAMRIHSGLRGRGVCSRMLVGDKLSDDPDIDSVTNTARAARVDEYANILLQKCGLQYMFVPSSRRTNLHPWVRQADLFQFFNTHGGYMSLGLLSRLGRRAPIIWRLSDLWAMTGHCAYPGNCTRWLQGCGECPDLGTYPPIGVDTTAMLWRKKQAVYRQCNITVVAPSSWAEEAARRSPLLGDREVRRVPNGINQEVFHPGDRSQARAQLGIRDQRLAILFSAHVAFDNSRKGSDLLLESLRRLGPRDDAFLIVAGQMADRWVGQVPMDVVPLGFLEGDMALAKAYSAADVVCVPSAVENLPNTALEAMACGKPVVAIDAGGMRDAVVDGVTGRLCPLGDAVAYAEALRQLLTDSGFRHSTGQAALDMVNREFTVEREIQRLHEIYRDVLERRAS